MGIDVLTEFDYSEDHDDTQKYCSKNNVNMYDFLNNKFFGNSDDDMLDICEYCFDNFISKNIKKIQKMINDDDDHIMNKYAVYYHDVKHNRNRAKKYYTMAIDKGNINAMANLGYYYHHEEQNVVLMKKYYMMAIENKNSFAMLQFAFYFQENDNVDMMIKYFKMAADYGNPYALYYTSEYYLKHNDYDMAEKYLLMSIDCENHEVSDGRIKSINMLAKTYLYLKKYHLAIKYFKMAIEHNHIESMIELGIYYGNEKNYDLMIKYFIMAFDNGNNDVVKYMADYLYLIEMYCLVDHPKFISKLMEDSKSKKYISAFLKNAKKMTCSICYRYNYCILKKESIICAICANLSDQDWHFKYNINTFVNYE